MTFELSKKERYAIVGFENCGTTSLHHFMQKEGYEVLHNPKGIIYGLEHLTNLKRRGYKFIIVTRPKPKKVNFKFDNGYDHDFKFYALSKNIDEIDYHFELNDLKEIKGFPWLNRHD